MKIANIITLSLVASLLLSGCSNYQAMRREVLVNNQTVDLVLTNYHQTLTASKQANSVVSTAVETGDTSQISSLKAVSDYPSLENELASNIVSLNNVITSYIKKNNTDVASQLQNGGHSTGKLITDSVVFAKSTLSVHYFLDSSTGKTEQLFQVTIPNGGDMYVSLVWLGGTVIATKAYGLN